MMPSTLLRLPPVTFSDRTAAEKKQETANDLLPVEGSDDEEALGKISSSFGSQSIPQKRKLFPRKRIIR
jgi:hypothetical protein